MKNLFGILSLFLSLSLTTLQASAENKKFTVKEVTQIMMCQGTLKCVGNSGYGGPCYTGYGGDLYNGYGGKCYSGYGGLLYGGYGGDLYAGYGGNCYAGYGGECYSGYGGKCDPNSSDASICPIQCETICGR